MSLNGAERPFRLPAVALAGACFLVGAQDTTAKRSSLPLRGLESFGALSYELYLFHFMVLCPLDAPIRYWHEVAAQATGRLLPLFDWGVWAAELLCIYLLALSIAKLYSEPLNRAIRATVHAAPRGQAADRPAPPPTQDEMYPMARQLGVHPSSGPAQTAITLTSAPSAVGEV